jgi:hypothetical protein
MHSAPAVSYPVGRSRFHGLLVAMIAAVGAIFLMLWVFRAGALQTRHLVAVMLWSTGLGLAAWHWLRTPTGSLAWDGQGWLWTSQTESCAVVPEVTLDTQGSLLLCLHKQHGNSLWTWPQRQTLPQRWLPFRRALFGRPPPMGDLGDNSALAQDGATGGSQ